MTYVADPNDNWWKENCPEIGKAVTAAGRADVIIACIGENTYCETPGNLNDLNLSSNQKELVRRLATTGKPVILVLNEGRPRIIHEIEPLAKAVVHIMLPGNYGGDALADLIAGDVNFSGKLPLHIRNSSIRLLRMIISRVNRWDLWKGSIIMMRSWMFNGPLIWIKLYVL